MIVYGDFKLSNIFFNMFMEVWIVDFGVSKILVDYGFGVSGVLEGYRVFEVMV